MSALREWLTILTNEDVHPQEFIDHFDLVNMKILKEKAIQYKDNIIKLITNDDLPEGVDIERASRDRDRVMENIRSLTKAIESLNLTEDFTLYGHEIILWKN